MPKLNALLAQLGYRYLLAQARYPDSVAAGSSFTLAMQWANVGVAPSYGGSVLGIQLQTLGGDPVATIVTTNLARDWLPGAFEIDQDIGVPATLGSGMYRLAVGLVDPATLQPEIRLSSGQRDSHGWYIVGILTVH
jgi:hypothetical protein